MKKLILLIICIAFLESFYSQAQTPVLQWAKNLGGIGATVVSNSIALDNSGNVYTTGRFSGKVDFDPGAATVYLTAVESNDIYITKTSASGVFQWVKQISAPSQYTNSITLDGTGNIYITGIFSGTVDFDPGPGTFNSSSSSLSLYFLKLDVSGNFIWAKNLGNTLSGEYSRSIKTDITGNILITGYFTGTRDFDPGPLTFNMSAISHDIFILKLSASGNFIWAKKIGGSSSEQPFSIATDSGGTIYCTGYFNGTCDFDPGVATFNLTAPGALAYFIVKLDASGNFVLAKSCGGSSNTTGSSIAVDGSGNIFTTGYFNGTTDFDPGAGTFNLSTEGNNDIFVTKSDPSGNFLWAKRIGSGNGDLGNSLATDFSGNVYITGFFQGVTDFDPGPGIINLSGTWDEIFILKLDASGNFVWAKSAGGIGYDQGNSITIDASGNVYTTGVFEEIADFDSGAGVFNLYAYGSADAAFISKLSSTGNLVWANGTGMSPNTMGKAIGEDSSGNIYVSGIFCGIADFDPGPGINNLSSTLDDTYGDIFIQKLNQSGDLLWAKKFGGISDDIVNAITVDGSGNVFLTGSFNGTVDFDPGANVFNLTAVNNDIFILKLNNLGNFEWARSVGGTQNDKGFGISLDGLGNIYTTGVFRSTVDFDPGAGVYNISSSGLDDVFILKLNATGTFIWAKQITGSNMDTGNSLKADAAGNVFITGNFAGITDFDPGAGTYNLTAVGSNDIFIAKLDASGNLLWAKNFGSISYDNAFSIDIDASGNLYTTGSFASTVDFDPGAGVFNLTSTGAYDIFISKLNSFGNFVWAKSMGGAYSDEGLSIKLDNTGNIYTTGYFSSTGDFDPGAGTFILTHSGNNDVFISILNASGNFIWAGSISGVNSEVGRGITTNGASFCVTGEFFGGVDFDPGAGTSNISTTGATDCFILKMGQCAPSAITSSGATTFCTGGSVALNANTGTGLTYQWKKNSVAIAGATTSSYVATTTGSYTVVVTSSANCTITSNVIQVTVSTAIPGAPGAITTTGGSVKVCPGDLRTYTVAAVSGVTSYIWTPCAGSVITSGQNTNSATIQYNSSFPVSDTLRVTAQNACGISAQRKLKISRNNPAAPSVITGDNYSVCNLSGKVYSVTNVSGMTYTWSFNTGTAIIASGQGTSSITVNYGAGFISGSLSVTASNACGTSAARVKTIYAKPATPVNITGATGVCLNQQDVPYSITPLSNITNYTWTGPTGSHISDGVNTSAGITLVTTSVNVTVDFATTSGTVKVRGNNACASGSYYSLPVNIICREGNIIADITKTSLYPNPASAYFTVETIELSEPFSLDVYDAYGKLVYTKVNINSGYQVLTNGWADGLYSVVVRRKEKPIVLKLAIRK